MNTIRETLLTLLGESNAWTFLRLIRKDEGLLASIDRVIPENLSLKEKVYVILNGREALFCPNGKKKTLISIPQGTKFCSKSCACAAQNISLKRKEGWARKTLEQKKKIRDKAAQTSIDRHGHAYTLSNPKFREQIKKTNLDRYGVENAGRTPQARDKAMTTIEQRYGSRGILGITKFKDKFLTTTRDRYGVDYAIQNPHVQDKRRQTTITRYGTPHYQTSLITEAARSILDDPVQLAAELEQHSILTLANLLDVSDCTVARHAIRHGIRIREPGRSSAEKAIRSWLTKHGITHIVNDRTLIRPYEVDILIPDHHLGIEFCGLYWHSELAGNKSRNYHRDKQLKINGCGFDGVFVFEDEWENAQDIVLSVIKTKLGLAPRGSGARKIEVRPISKEQGHVFTQKYHLQGSGNRSICYGGFLHEQLVGVMIFGSPTRQNSGQYELSRFCSTGTIYPGLESKLFTAFIREYRPDQVVTFSDNRWFSGDSYLRLGFQPVGIVPPDYAFVRQGVRYHKSAFRREKIESKFGVHLGSTTAWKFLSENGYDRIWDCGKRKFEWLPSAKLT